MSSIVDNSDKVIRAFFASTLLRELTRLTTSSHIR